MIIGLYLRNTNHYNNRVQASNKLTPKQSSLETNQENVHKNLLDKQKKVKPKTQVNDLVRTADLKRTFSKSDTTDWYYKIYEITKVKNDTIPSYHIDKLPER